MTLLLTSLLVLMVIGILAFTVILSIPNWRQSLISSQILRVFRQLQPKISKTEKEALESGTVSFEGNIFTGHFDLEKLLSLPDVKLTQEEQSFLEGPVDELCRMVDDWKVSEDGDLPKEAWDFMKAKGFFGMIIPKQFGGLDFSAWANSCVVVKTGTRSVPLAVTIAVPNSLGPAELILKYGTQEQKDYYLPRLARGDEVPCFALTGPHAGSDAASIPDTGIVCYGEWEGKQSLGVRLNWEKRYITLAPVATLIGLAFKMRDPDHLLGDIEDIGITCALVPAHLPGVVTGHRHNPMHTHFQNGPTQGHDVFIPLTQIIGGAQKAGQGWRMLMECLSAGRAITLPSGGAGGACYLALATGAYARIREQFNVPLAHLDGIHEPLALLAANAYTNSSALRFTLAAIDSGQEPPVASAIVKYHTTERLRQSVLAGMDIHSGKGICIGPKNYLRGLYHVAPIDITVEGANILTRCVIIFGQGALRCHPYLLKEIRAAQENNLVEFDKAIFGHAAFVVGNLARSLGFSIAGRFLPTTSSDFRNIVTALRRLTASFCFASDVAALTLAGSLKRKERITARLGDALSCIYLASANIKRFHDDKRPQAELPLLQYACQDLLHQAEIALDEVCRNLPNRTAGWMLRFAIFPLGKLYKRPSDRLATASADLLTSPSETRWRFSKNISMLPDSALVNLEEALHHIHACEPIYRAIRDAKKQKLILGEDMPTLLKEARRQNIISSEDEMKVTKAQQMRLQIITVDDFSPETYPS